MCAFEKFIDFSARKGCLNFFETAFYVKWEKIAVAFAGFEAYYETWILVFTFSKKNIKNKKKLKIHTTDLKF